MSEMMMMMRDNNGSSLVCFTGMSFRLGEVDVAQCPHLELECQLQGISEHLLERHLTELKKNNNNNDVSVSRKVNVEIIAHSVHLIQIPVSPVNKPWQSNCKCDHA